MDGQAGIIEALRAGGFLRPGEAHLTPLTGGVSSDVFRLDRPGEPPVCVKRSLETLRVAQEWRVRRDRNHSEVEYLAVAGAIVGEAVPRVKFEDRASHLFVMTFYEPADHPVWKAELAAGRIDAAFAGQVGALLAAIHGQAPGLRQAHRRFPNHDLFEELRLSPYLRRTAEVHADLAGVLTALAETTAATRLTLVHGDVSPKNILCGPGGPVLLDAECAVWGDPAFDLAFCATHLLLKGVWKPAHDYAAAFSALVAAYLRGVAFAGVEARAAALTAGLLLARVDGKSPVEYLDEAGRRAVRAAARGLLQRPPGTMVELADRWRESLT